MAWDFIVWISAFFLQAALLGIIMYGVSNKDENELLRVKTLVKLVRLMQWHEMHPKTHLRPTLLCAVCAAVSCTSVASSSCPLTLCGPAAQLILLSDLENDFINPHDSSARINNWVVCACRAAIFEFVSQTSFTLPACGSVRSD